MKAIEFITACQKRIQSARMIDIQAVVNRMIVSLKNASYDAQYAQ